MNMQKHDKIIGIIGGVGIAAGIDVCSRIMTLCQKEYNAEMDWDFPHFILNSLNMTGFDETGIADYQHVLSEMTKASLILEKAGADFIIIACNTLHVMIPEIQKV